MSKKIISILLAVAMVTMVMTFNGVFANEEQGYNVALGKATWASSTYGADGLAASNVVDGNISTAWSIGYYPNDYQYWAVDLGRAYNIDEIKFIGREGNVDERKGFNVEVANKSDFTDKVVVQSVASDGQPYDPNLTQIICVSDTTNYRYVRIIKTDYHSSPLYLSEVMVMSRDETADLVEICHGKPATADNTYPYEGVMPGHANDGNYSTRWLNNFVYGYVPKWTVDLGNDYSNYKIEQIKFKLINNTYMQQVSGTTDPLNSGFSVLLSNDANFATSIEVYKNSISDGPAEGEQTVDLSNSYKSYRYLRIIQNRAAVLLIDEVSVFAHKMGENIALGKQTTANSNHATGWYPSSKVVDGEFLIEDSSQWKSNPYIQPAYVELIVDLGKKYNISSLLYQMGDQPTCQTNFQIEMSEDAEFTLNEIVYTQPNGVNSTGKQILNLEQERLCRYIKFKTTGQLPMGDYTYFGIAEIQAFSFDNLSLDKNIISFTTSKLDKTIVETVPSSNKFTINFSVTNPLVTSNNIIIYQVGYKNGKFNDLKVYPMIIPSSVYGLMASEDVLIPNNDSTTYRFFVWEKDTIRPLYFDKSIAR